jgi:hypothetical protein
MKARPESAPPGLYAGDKSTFGQPSFTAEKDPGLFAPASVNVAQDPTLPPGVYRTDRPPLEMGFVAGPVAAAGKTTQAMMAHAADKTVPAGLTGKLDGISKEAAQIALKARDMGLFQPEGLAAAAKNIDAWGRQFGYEMIARRLFQPTRPLSAFGPKMAAKIGAGVGMAAAAGTGAKIYHDNQSAEQKAQDMLAGEEPMIERDALRTIQARKK